MAELTGAEAVKAYIIQTTRPCFEIYRANESAKNLPIYEYAGQNANQAADAFDDWAKTFNNGGMNFQQYKIVVSNGNDPTDDTTVDGRGRAGVRKRQSAMTTTFILNAMPGYGAPRRDNNGEVIYIGAPQPQQQPVFTPGADYVSKKEMEAILAHHAENRKIEMELLIMKQRQTQLEAENLWLQRELREYEKDDDEEEEESVGSEKALEIWTPEAIRELMKDGKNTFLEIKGSMSGVQQAPKEKLNQVAGPVYGSQAAITIPDGAEPGTYPPYVTPTAENAELISKDQQIKINKAIPLLYGKNVHIGDDLLKVLSIAETNTPRFNGIIETLREEK